MIWLLRGCISENSIKSAHHDNDWVVLFVPRRRLLPVSASPKLAHAHSGRICIPSNTNCDKCLLDHEGWRVARLLHSCARRTLVNTLRISTLSVDSCHCRWALAFSHVGSGWQGSQRSFFHDVPMAIMANHDLLWKRRVVIQNLWQPSLIFADICILVAFVHDGVDDTVLLHMVCGFIKRLH